MIIQFTNQQFINAEIKIILKLYQFLELASKFNIRIFIKFSVLSLDHLYNLVYDYFVLLTGVLLYLMYCLSDGDVVRYLWMLNKSLFKI